MKEMYLSLEKSYELAKKDYYKKIERISFLGFNIDDFKSSSDVSNTFFFNGNEDSVKKEPKDLANITECFSLIMDLESISAYLVSAKYRMFRLENFNLADEETDFTILFNFLLEHEPSNNYFNENKSCKLVDTFLKQEIKILGVSRKNLVINVLGSNISTLLPIFMKREDRDINEINQIMDDYAKGNQFEDFKALSILMDKSNLSKSEIASSLIAVLSLYLINKEVEYGDIKNKNTMVKTYDNLLEIFDFIFKDAGQTVELKIKATKLIMDFLSKLSY